MREWTDEELAAPGMQHTGGLRAPTFEEELETLINDFHEQVKEARKYKENGDDFFAAARRYMQSFETAGRIRSLKHFCKVPLKPAFEKEMTEVAQEVMEFLRELLNG